MALYREDATGFVQEHSSNPGVGYTAIPTMPTTSIGDKAEWWRDLDKWNQTSDWHPSLDDTAEDPNDNYLAISFTNESALVSADSDGNVTDGFLGATTEVRIMRGSRNVTVSEGWSLGLAKSPDNASFTYTWTGTDVKTLQITGFPTDETAGYIRITAVRTGSLTLVKDFKILKVIKGADGTDGVNGVRGSRQIVVAGTSWTDTAAWNGIVAQTGTTPVLSDLVTIANAATSFSVSKFYSGGSSPGTWTVANEYINGNLLVTGTVGANRLVAGSITTSYLSFTPVQAGGAATDINNYATTISGTKITTGSITASQIAANTITASQIAANTITASQIAASTITTAKLSFTPVQAGGSAADINANATTITGTKISTGTITADQIAANTITTAKLNFTPVQTSNVVASINASAEGITISGSKLTINSSTTFGSGYDPSAKITTGGAAADINANTTTINGGKITTGTLSADVISGGTINGSTVNVTNLNATNITGGSLSVDRLSVGSITAPKFANNSTTRVSSTGGSDTYSTMSGGATYTVSQYTTASPPSGGRSAGGTNRVFVNITGTVYTNNATDRGFTFYVMRNSGSGWTALSTAVAIYVRAANCSSNYGIPFALQATDYYVGDTDTVSYTLGIMNAAGFSGLANPYTFTYGVTAIDQYK